MLPTTRNLTAPPTPLMSMKNLTISHICNTSELMPCYSYPTSLVDQNEIPIDLLYQQGCQPWEIDFLTIYQKLPKFSLLNGIFSLLKHELVTDYFKQFPYFAENWPKSSLLRPKIPYRIRKFLTTWQPCINELSCHLCPLWAWRFWPIWPICNTIQDSAILKPPCTVQVW